VVVFWLGWESASRLLDDDPRTIETCFDCLFLSLSQSDLGEVSTDEGVTASVGVDDLLLADRNDWKLFDFSVVDEDDWEMSLGEDDGSWPLLVGLWKICDLSCDFDHIFVLVSESPLLSESDGLVLVSLEDVDVREELFELGREIFCDERCSDRSHEDLVVLRSVTGNLDCTLNRNSEEKTSRIINLCLFHEFPDFWFLEMGDFEMICCSKFGDEGSFLVGDENCTDSSGMVLVLLIFDIHSILRGDLLEDLSVGVLSHSSSE